MSRQRGASLLVSMIFLVIMAMLGISLANVTRLEEQMAGNTRDRDIALQAAEAALRDAQVRLAQPGFRAIAFSAFDPNNDNDAAFWDGCFDGGAAPCGLIFTPATLLPTVGAGRVDAQPRYVIERKPNVGALEIFRVTTRAVGGSADTVVVLQAEFSV